MSLPTISTMVFVLSTVYGGLATMVAVAVKNHDN